MRREAEAGFTLIEALVALALGVAVVTVVLSTLRIAATSATRAAATLQDAEAFARAGAVLAGEARHALRGPGDALFTGQARRLEFPAVAQVAGERDILLRLTLSDAGLLTESQAPILDSGKPGIFTPELPIWQAEAGSAFRYLGPEDWQRDWAGPGLPRAFALAPPGGDAVILVAEFPDLIQAACLAGPGEACSLPPEDFP